MDTNSPLQKENTRKKKAVLDSEEGTFAISPIKILLYIVHKNHVTSLYFEVFCYSMMYIHDLRAILFN